MSPLVKIGPFSLQRDKNSPAFLSVEQDIEINQCSINTLEGPNQSGKSTIVKMITGTLSKDISVDKPLLQINGKSVAVNSVQDANKNGIVSVFQDNDLIPTFTVAENIFLHHSFVEGRSLFQLIYSILHNVFIHPLSWLIEAGPFPDGLRKASHKMHPTFVDLGRQRELREKALTLLSPFGDTAVDILDRLPGQLTGGARALAKVVNALLHENIVLLILDEPFTGVQRDFWPRLIENILSKAKEKHFSVLAITHVQEEILRWQPEQKLVVRNGKIEIEIRPQPRIFFPIVSNIEEYPTALFLEGDQDVRREKIRMLFGYLTSNCQQAYIVIDPSLCSTEPVREIVNCLQAYCSKVKIRNVDEFTEKIDGFQKLRELLEDFINFSNTDKGVFLFIGGGLLLNFCGFLASIVHRGRWQTVYCPTTIIAMSDVAIGSKTCLPFVSQIQKVGPHKHILGTFLNPSAAILDDRFLETLTESQVLFGLSESLKHALLQDNQLFETILNILRGKELKDRNSLFQVVKTTIGLKSEIMAIDASEEGYGRLLLYGHNHSNALEEASDFTISHGVAVLIGILVELQLCGKEDIFDKLITAYKQYSNLFPSIDIKESHKKLKSSYERLCKSIFMDEGKVVSIDLTSPGEFSAENIIKNRPSFSKEVAIEYSSILNDFVESRLKTHEIQHCLAVQTKVYTHLGLDDC